MKPCTNPDILKAIYYIKVLISIAKYVLPMGLILMLGIDMVKNIMAGKDDEMSKSMRTASKRLLYAVVK